LASVGCCGFYRRFWRCRVANWFDIKKEKKEGEMNTRLQSSFIQHLIKGVAPTTVFLVNGVKLSGTPTWADDVSMTLARDGITQLVMIPAIATIMPQDAFSIFDVVGDGE
jgi:host factor-I protein